MAEMRISNTLVNDTSTGEIAYADQVKDRILRKYIAENPDYTTTDKGRIPSDIKAEIGVFQTRLNEFFLDHWVAFQRFMLDEGVNPSIIDSWYEVKRFLEGLDDDTARWLKTKLNSLDTAIASIDQDGIGTFDISAYNNVEGTYATYANLDTALSAVPIASRRSGMTIRYIDSSTDEYKQYRYMLQYSDTTSGNNDFVDTDNWTQGGVFSTGESVDNIGIDNEPTAGSNNLVKSGGVFSTIINTLNDVPSINKLKGKGSSIVSTTFAPIEGHVYKIIMHDTDWQIPSISQVAAFYISGYDGSGYNRNIEEISIADWETQKPKSEYVFRFDSNMSTNGNIRIGLRALEGEEIRYSVIDITAENYEYTIVGSNLGKSKVELKNLVGGRGYNIVIKNPFWDCMSYTQNVFSCESVDSLGVTTQIFSIVKTGRKQNYRFAVPTDSEKIIISAYCALGENIEFSVNDITGVTSLRNFRNFVEGQGSVYSDLSISTVGGGDYEFYFNKKTYSRENYEYGESFSIKYNTTDDATWVNLVYSTDRNFENELYYKFTLPDNVKYIKIGGRCDIGENIEFVINKVSPLIENAEKEIDKLKIEKVDRSTLDDFVDTSVFTLCSNYLTTISFSTKLTVANSSVNKQLPFRKVNCGDVFYVSAKAATSTEYSVTFCLFNVPPTSAGISYTVIKNFQVTVNTPLNKEKIVVPEDGYMAVYLNVNENGIREFGLSEDVIHISPELEESTISYTLDVNYLIDCNPSSATFGEAISNLDTNHNYGCSDFIDISDIKYVITASNYSGARYLIANMRDKSVGTVFYDENKIPIDCSENNPVQLTGYGVDYKFTPIYDASVAVKIKVPKNAKFVRFVDYAAYGTSVTRKVYKNRYKTNNLDDLVSQAKWVRQTGTATGYNNVTPVLSLLHFSDIHSDTTASDFVKKIASTPTLADDILCTGDVVCQFYNSTNAPLPGTGYNWTYGNDATHGYKWWTEITEMASKCLFVLGNHDNATAATTEYDQKEDSAAWDGMGKDFAYTTYFEPYAQELGITQPSGVDDSESPNYHACYWHKDYAAQKIRLIGLDCMHRYDGLLDSNGNPISDSWVKHGTIEQETWLKERLNETLDETSDVYGWSVLFACHYPLDDWNGYNEEWNDSTHKFDYNDKSNGGIVMNHRTNSPTIFHEMDNTSGTLALKFNMRNRVQSATSYTGYTKGNENHIGDIINSWINLGGKCIAWVSGHTHVDYMFYPTRYPNILNVVIDKAGNDGTSGSNLSNRTVSEQSRGCANLIVIDTENSYLKIIRFGITTNKRFDKKQVLCYDYLNRVIKNEW